MEDFHKVSPFRGARGRANALRLGLVVERRRPDPVRRDVQGPVPRDATAIDRSGRRPPDSHRPRPRQLPVSVLLTLCFWLPGVVHALLLARATAVSERADRLADAVLAYEERATKARRRFRKVRSGLRVTSARPA